MIFEEGPFWAFIHTLNIICGYYTPTNQMIAHNIIISFCILSSLKYDRFFGQNLEHDIYGVK